MSALGGFFDGGDMLDICAGSGAVGIELLSRGIARAVFVDPSPDAVGVIVANLKRCKMTDKAQVIPFNADKALARLAQEPRRFDFAYVDPPWEEGLIDPIVAAVADADIVRDDGEIIVEAPRSRESTWNVPDGWTITWQRAYGRCEVTRLVKASTDESDDGA